MDLMDGYTADGEVDPSGYITLDEFQECVKKRLDDVARPQSSANHSLLQVFPIHCRRDYYRDLNPSSMET